MSEQQAPDRTVRGFGAARASGGVHPDARRLLARNRVTPPATAPAAAPTTSPAPAPAAAVAPSTVASAAQVEPGATAAVRALRRAPAVDNQAVEPVAAPVVPGGGVKAQVNVMVATDLRARVRSAYRATSAQEGHRSFSDFVASLLEAEATRLEHRYNDGRPFAGGEQPLPPGRPLND